MTQTRERFDIMNYFSSAAKPGILSDVWLIPRRIRYSRQFSDLFREQSAFVLFNKHMHRALKMSFFSKALTLTINGTNLQRRNEQRRPETKPVVVRCHVFEPAYYFWTFAKPLRSVYMLYVADQIRRHVFPTSNHGRCVTLDSVKHPH